MHHMDALMLELSDSNLVGAPALRAAAAEAIKKKGTDAFLCLAPKPSEKFLDELRALAGRSDPRSEERRYIDGAILRVVDRLEGLYGIAFREDIGGHVTQDRILDRYVSLRMLEHRVAAVLSQAYSLKFADVT